MIIAIDGTLASGKGTLARRLAEYLALPHLDTGALYRAAALRLMEAGGSSDDINACVRAAKTVAPGAYPDAALRSAEVGANASRIARHPKVRAALFELQRAFALSPAGGVIDGRDITTVIAPEAPVKLFVDADPVERAKRRHAELTARGETVSLNAVVDQVIERDTRDRTRKDAPLTRVSDALLIDTTHLSIDAAFSVALMCVEGATGHTG